MQTLLSPQRHPASMHAAGAAEGVSLFFFPACLFVCLLQAVWVFSRAGISGTTRLVLAWPVARHVRPPAPALAPVAHVASPSTVWLPHTTPYRPHTAAANSGISQADASEARFFPLPFCFLFFFPPPRALYRWIFRKRQLRAIGLRLCLCVSGCLHVFLDACPSPSLLVHSAPSTLLAQQHWGPCSPSRSRSPPRFRSRLSVETARVRMPSPYSSLHPEVRNTYYVRPAVRLPDGNGFSTCFFRTTREI